MKTTIIFLTLMMVLVGVGAANLTAQSTSRVVVVNGSRVSDEFLQTYEAYIGTRVPSGSYWYDATAGVWGMDGGPMLGFTFPGMNLGRMSPTASRGNTGTFINGREMHSRDVSSLNQIIRPYSVQRGRFWVDSSGNFGYENGQFLGNLVQIAQANYPQSAGGNGKSSGYNSGIGSVMSDGSGFLGYVSGSSSASKY